MQPSFKDMNRVFRELDNQFHFRAIARTVRFAHSGSNNSLMAFLHMDGETYESTTMNFDIVDRVGGGDAFSSGLIFALMKKHGATDGCQLRSCIKRNETFHSW